MCNGLFWVFDFLLVLICFLVLAFKMSCIFTHRKLFVYIPCNPGVCSLVCCLFFVLLQSFAFEFSFYTKYSLPGGCSLVWVFAWFLLVWDSPAQHPHISAKEKVAFIFCQLRADFANIRTYHQEYIEKSLEGGGKVERGKVPWRHLLTSIPLWGCVLGLSVFV